MALNIKNGEVVELIRKLARERDVDLTEAVRLAVVHELAGKPGARESRLRRMSAISRRIAALPVLDARSPDQILGYDETGLTT
jgi:antitoxin VapB